MSGADARPGRGPKRIQRQRTKGWRLPIGTVVVSRPSLWGNPWAVGDPGIGTQPDGSPWLQPDVVRWFRTCARQELARNPGWLAPLRGHDLACWCPLCPTHADGLPLDVACPDCALCHADVLLELANA